MKNNFDNSEIRVDNVIKIIKNNSFFFKLAKWCIGTLIVIIILNIIIFNFFVIRIPIGFIGVRTNNLGILGKKGIVSETFNAGYHRSFLFLDSWNLFDATAQTLELSRIQYFEANKSAILYKSLSRNTQARESKEQIRLTTSEGYNVDVDVTAKYQIKKDEAYQLLQELGGENKYKQIVKNIVLDNCRQIFGAMTAEDFYNPEIKKLKISKVEKLLKVELAKRHVILIDLLIRDVAFDPNYEEKIREKKLADQDIILNQSKAAATLQRGVTDKITAETAALVKIKIQEQEATMAEIEAKTNEAVAKITADYMKYVTEKESDADLYAAKKRADGQLLIKKSEAEGERLLNQALANLGGSRLVALEAARNLRLKNFILSSKQFNPLDLKKVYKLLDPGYKKK
ncbi:MAG: hypothetical protein KAI43_09820 [Candidatus Aureabacteria bacterium]|nr:hypothetical protein [Candidatus Auribacterota bacterium]